MKNKFVLAITAIMVVLLSIFVVSFANYLAKEFQRARLAARLDSLVESYKKGEVDTINLSTITRFEWDTLFLFGPYTTKERIVEITGLMDAANIETSIDYDDSIVLFVFVNENKIVQYMDFHRDPDFVYSLQESPYNPNNAIFVLNEKGQPIPISQ